MIGRHGPAGFVSTRSSPCKVRGLESLSRGGIAPEWKMESELDMLRRANAELQAWVRDLLEENRYLRNHLAERREPEAPAVRKAAEPSLI